MPSGASFFTGNARNTSGATSAGGRTTQFVIGGPGQGSGLNEPPRIKVSSSSANGDGAGNAADDTKMSVDGDEVKKLEDAKPDSNFGPIGSYIQPEEDSDSDLDVEPETEVRVRHF
jgi:hypothetical protein